MKFFKKQQSIETPSLAVEPPPLPNDVYTNTVEMKASSKNSSDSYSAQNETSTTGDTAELTNAEKKVLDKTEKSIARLYDMIIGEKIPDTTEGRDLLKDLLIDIMANMKEFADIRENSGQASELKYATLNASFQELIKIKNAVAEEMRDVFEEIFKEFGDFIDDEIIFQEMCRIEQENLKKLRKQARLEKPDNQTGLNESSSNEKDDIVPLDIESITQKVYGRSVEEVEKIKKRNRKELVKTIQEMAQKDEIIPEMIIELHRVNNQGIVPKMFSALRSGENSGVSFGERVGILGEDVQTEIDLLTKKATELIRTSHTGISSIRYEVKAAQLHNALLDIHPFTDRNGSTSLSFLELLMTKIGYQPTEERPKNKYYDFLKKILNNNFVAISVIAYEHYLIHKVPGYYKGETTKDQKKQSQYKAFLARVSRNRAIRALEKKISKTHDQKRIAELRAQINAIEETKAKILQENIKRLQGTENNIETPYEDGLDKAA